MNRSIAITAGKAALICATAFACAALAHSQELTVRLLDGKTGKPMKNKNVAVRFSPDFLHEVQVRVGSDGTGRATIPTAATTISLSVGYKDGKEPYRIAYEDCNDSSLIQISVDEVIRRGLSKGNQCGRAVATAKPGEVIFWAHSIPWWMPDFQ